MSCQRLNTRLITNFGLLAGGEAISKLFALAAFAYLARALGPTQFGDLELALALIAFFALIVDSGLSATGTREIARNPKAIARITIHIVFLRCILALFAFGALLLLLWLIAKSPSQQRLIVLFGFTLLVLPGLLTWVFQGCDLMQYVACASMLRWSIFANGVFLFVYGGPDQIWKVPVIEGAALIAAVAFYFYLFVNRFEHPREKISLDLALSLFRRAVPIGASELVWALKIYFATILLGAFFGGAEVGLFGAAHRIVISLHTFVWLYFFNLLPSLTRSQDEKPEVLHGLIQKSLQLAGWASVLIVLFGLSFGKEIITLIYGNQFQEATPAFKVLIWLIPLALMSGHFRYALIAYDHQRLEFLAAAGGAAVNVLLNIALNPAFGQIGAAWALVSSEALIWVLSYYMVWRRIAQIPLWMNLWQPLLGGLFVAGFFHFLPAFSIWITASSAIFLCGLVLAVMRRNLFNVRSILVWNR